MASGVKPRVKVPKTAAAGEAITIKTLISHKMESGQRKDKQGQHYSPFDHQSLHLRIQRRDRCRCDIGTGDFDKPLFPVRGNRAGIR